MSKEIIYLVYLKYGDKMKIKRKITIGEEVYFRNPVTKNIEKGVVKSIGFFVIVENTSQYFVYKTDILEE